MLTNPQKLRLQHPYGKTLKSEGDISGSAVSNPNVTLVVSISSSSYSSVMLVSYFWYSLASPASAWLRLLINGRKWCISSVIVLITHPMTTCIVVGSSQYPVTLRLRQNFNGSYFALSCMLEICWGRHRRDHHLRIRCNCEYQNCLSATPITEWVWPESPMASTIAA